MENQAKILKGKPLIVPDTNLGQFVLDHLRKNVSHIAQVINKYNSIISLKIASAFKTQYSH